MIGSRLFQPTGRTGNDIALGSLHLSLCNPAPLLSWSSRILITQPTLSSRSPFRAGLQKNMPCNWLLWILIKQCRLKAIYNSASNKKQENASSVDANSSRKYHVWEIDLDIKMPGNSMSIAKGVTDILNPNTYTYSSFFLSADTTGGPEKGCSIFWKMDVKDMFENCDM